jgi:hypothetical protein
MTRILLLLSYEKDCHRYGSEVEDSSVQESGSDTSTPEAEIAGADSDSSVDIQALQ